MELQTINFIGASISYEKVIRKGPSSSEWRFIAASSGAACCEALKAGFNKSDGLIIVVEKALRHRGRRNIISQ